MTKVGAVILSFGHEPRFLDLLDDVASVLSQSDIAVVHNPYAPSDLWRPQVPAPARVIRMPDNVGYARAMNAGLAEVSSDWVLLLTHDVQFEPAQLLMLVHTCENLPADVGIVGPSLLFPDGRRSFGSDIDERGWVGHLDAPPAPGPVIDVPFVDGSAMVVRREMWRAVGGLCPRYFMYFEEPDLCDRARHAGWRTVVLTGIQIRSSPGSSSRPAAYGFLYARNGYDWARRMRGPRVARRFAMAQIRHIGRSLPYHRWQLRPAVAVAALAMSGGRLLGLAAALSGRVNGRPPSYLTCRSDIAAPETG